MDFRNDNYNDDDNTCLFICLSNVTGGRLARDKLEMAAREDDLLPAIIIDT